MIRERIEILFGYIQFLALILSIPDVPFPDVNLGNILEFFSLFDVFNWIPWPTDFKIQFVIVVVAVPQIINFLILIGLNRKRVVVWYFLTLSFIAAFIAGAILRILGVIRDTTDRGYVTNANTLLIVGGVGLGISIAAAVADYVFGDRTVHERIEKAERDESNQEMSIRKDQGDIVDQFEKEHEVQLTHEEQMMLKSHEFPVGDTLLRLCIFGGCLFMGLLMIGVIAGGWRDTMLSGAGMLSLATTFGAVFLGAAFFVLVWLIMGLVRKGRLAQLKIGYFCEVNLMRICLIFLSLVYIPIIARIVMVFNCNDFSCPAGSFLKPIATSVVYNESNRMITSNPGEQCEWCVPSDTCPDASINTEFCPAQAYERLEYARNLPCDEMYTYFFPAGLLMLLSFAVGLPLAFMKLTSMSANMLAASFPVLYTGDQSGLTEADIWALKVNQSSNITRFLYQSFQFKWKQWRLLMLIHKLIIVITTVFIIRTQNDSADNLTSRVPIVFAMVVHCLAFAMIAKIRPFIHLAEDRVYLVMQLCLTLTAVAGFMAIFGIWTIPLWLAIALLILNIIVPLVALCVTLYYTSRDVKIETDKIQGKEGARKVDSNSNHHHHHPQSGSASLNLQSPASVRPEQPMAFSSNGGASIRVESSPQQRGAPPPPHNPFYTPAQQAQLQHASASHTEHRTYSNTAPVRGGNGGGGADDDDKKPLTGGAAENNSHHLNANTAAARNLNNLDSEDEEGFKDCGDMTMVSATYDESSDNNSSQPNSHNKRTATLTKKTSSPYLQTPVDGPLNNTTGSATGLNLNGSLGGGALNQSYLARGDAKTSILKRARKQNHHHPHPDIGGSGAHGSGSGIVSGGGAVVSSSTSHRQEGDRQGAAPPLENNEFHNAAQVTLGYQHLGFIDASVINRFNSQEQPMVVLTDEELNAIEQLDEADRVKAIEERYKKAQAEVDKQIDDVSLYIVRKYFMICGALGFLALGLCVLGIVETGFSDTRIELSLHQTPQSRTEFTEFVQYSDWSAFTNDCCCMPFYNDWNAETDHGALAIEKWTCKNGWTKERARSTKRTSGLNETTAKICAEAVSSGSLTAEQLATGSLIDCVTHGFDVRGMCQLAFSNGCALNSGINIARMNGTACASSISSESQILW